MKKQVKVTLKTSYETIEYETNAMFQEEKETLSWIEKDPFNTHFSIDFKTKKIIRENKECKMILTFDKKQDKILSCKLKEMEKEVIFEIEILKLTMKKNYFEITYFLKDEMDKEETKNLKVDFR